MYNIVKLNSLPKSGIRAVIYGAEKVGKTTLALSTPKPLYVALEKGVVLDGLPDTVSTIPGIDSYENLNSLVDWMIGECKNGKLDSVESIVIDSLTALETMIKDSILSDEKNLKATMGSAMGGYGKAFDYMTSLVNKLLAKFDILSQTYGKNVFFISHAVTYKAVDADLGEVWRTDLCLNGGKSEKGGIASRELVVNNADLICLIKSVRVKNQDGEIDNMRVAVVQASENAVAGNRFGVRQDIPLPAPAKDAIMWNYIANAIHQASGRDFFTR